MKSLTEIEAWIQKNNQHPKFEMIKMEVYRINEMEDKKHNHYTIKAIQLVLKNIGLHAALLCLKAVQWHQTTYPTKMVPFATPENPLFLQVVINYQKDLHIKVKNSGQPIPEDLKHYIDDVDESWRCKHDQDLDLEITGKIEKINELIQCTV